MNVAQALLGLRRQRIIRIFLKEGLEFILGRASFAAVAVRLFQLFVVRHGHLQLRGRGLRQERKENNKIFVARDGLRQVGFTALFVVRIRDGQFGIGQELAVRVGVNQGLEGKPANLLPAVLDIAQRAVVEFLVGCVCVFGCRSLLLRVLLPPF